MNNIRLAFVVAGTALAVGHAGFAQAAPAKSPFAISIEPIGTYATGIFDKSSAEIVAHDPRTQRLFVVNAESGKIDVLSILAPDSPTLLFSVDLGAVFPNGQGVVNSVDVFQGVVAAAVEAVPKTDPGRVVFFDAASPDGLVFLGDVEAGALPDAVTFTPDGKRVLVANEGEPNDDYTIDPEGSVSIIDLPKDISQLTQAHVRSATFTKFNEADLDPQIRIFGPPAAVVEGQAPTRTVAQNLEPEWISVAKDSQTAWVVLQEANAIAVLDIEAGEFTAIRALGFKDHLLPGNELDVSDRDGRINITNWPVLGMYMPDTIANYQYQGRNYIVSANEGDSRDWEGSPGYSEVSRFRALSGDTPICADSDRVNAFYANNEMGITNLAELRENNNMGRLNVTRENGLRLHEDGTPDCYEDIYAFGARSFSIWNEDLELVWDSGSEFERITVAINPPEFFNSNHRQNSFETRSDDKGPEPEGVVVAKLWGRDYAFIGLERIGGVMIFDISNPYAPHFVQYLNNRDFNSTPGTPEAGDLGAEGLIVIEATKSPIPGVPLLVVGNEVSGTTTIFRINRERLVGNPPASRR